MPQDPTLQLPSGPFSKYLETQPTFEAPKQQPSGYAHAAGNTAFLLDQFLSGVSRGRQMAFARSEQERNTTLSSINQAITAVQSSNVPDTVKSQQLARLMQMQGQLFLADHSHDGGGKKGKKSQVQDPFGNAMPDAPDQQQGVGHHVMTAMRGLVENMLGPGAQKMSMDPKDIKSTLFEVYHTIGLQENSMEAHAGKADQAVQQSLQALNQRLGHHASTAELNADQAFTQAASQSRSLYGGKESPAVASVYQAAQDEEARNDPYRVEQARYYAAESDEKKALAAKDYALARNANRYKAADGSPIFQGTNGWEDIAKKPIPPEDPRLKSITPWQDKKRAPQLVRGQDGNVHARDVDTGEDLGAFLVNGRPYKVSTPEGRALLSNQLAEGRIAETQDFINDRDLGDKQFQVNQRYDAELATVDGKSNLTPKQREAAKSAIDDRRQRALDSVRTEQRRRTPRSAPPPEKETSDDDLLNSLFGAAPTGAPPSGTSSVQKKVEEYRKLY